MTSITPDQREILTLFFLVLLGIGIYRIIHAAIQSNRVYRSLPRSKREVRGPIQMAKWMMVAQMVFLWLTIQGWLDFLGNIRAIFFAAAAISAVIVASLLDRGYSRYWDDLKDLPRGRYDVDRS